MRGIGAGLADREHRRDIAGKGQLAGDEPLSDRLGLRREDEAS